MADRVLSVNGAAAVLISRPLIVAYRGSSMVPTLREPQLMEVVPYDERPIRRGDVILFSVAGQDLQVVHRVLDTNGGALLTCGDNNRRPDRDPVQRGQVIGQVVGAWEGRRRRAISGGRRGLVQARLVRGRQRLVALAARPVRLAYVVSVLCHLQRLVPPRWRPRLVTLAGDDGARHFLTLGGRIVGRYDSARRQWHVRYPYRFLVDAEAVDAAVQR
jgi:hypothetical protein